MLCRWLYKTVSFCATQNHSMLDVSIKLFHLELTMLDFSIQLSLLKKLSLPEPFQAVWNFLRWWCPLPCWPMLRSQEWWWTERIFKYLKKIKVLSSLNFKMNIVNGKKLKLKLQHVHQIFLVSRILDSKE